jgi:uncharacterized phage-associated protein
MGVTMFHNPKSIANYFLDLAWSSGQSIDPMKLQKLVYYAVGWYAGYMGQQLVNENVEAWPFGPVIPSLYHEFKQFGAGQITSKATDFTGTGFAEVPTPSDPNLRRFLENIWSSYGQFTGWKLSEMTHAPGGPWELTWREAGGMRGSDIPFDRIAQHFHEAARNATHQGAVA